MTVQTAGTRKEVLKNKRGSDPCAYCTSVSSAELMTFPSASAPLYVQRHFTDVLHFLIYMQPVVLLAIQITPNSCSLSNGDSLQRWTNVYVHLRKTFMSRQVGILMIPAAAFTHRGAGNMPLWSKTNDFKTRQRHHGVNQTVITRYCCSLMQFLIVSLFEMKHFLI